MERLRLPKNSFLIFLSFALAFAIFASWHLIPTLFGVLPQTFFVASSSSFLQSLQSWQPLIDSVAHGNFTPIAPNSNSGSDFYFYPYLTIWFFAAILHFFGENGELILTQVLLPTACFALIVTIFLRYLSVRWSVAIAFLSTMSFSGLPFRKFLFGLTTGESFDQITTLQPLEILHFPFPSISLLVFLSIYYFCIKQVRLSKLRISVFSILWSLSAQIHLFDAAFGLVFWFAYFPIRFFRQEKLTNISQVLTTVIFQILLSAVILSPFLFLKTNGLNSLEHYQDDYSVSYYYYVFYFLIPIFGIIFTYFVFRVDFYEIFLKFWHIYVLMLGELLLVSLLTIFDFGTGISMVKNRVPFFFLHFYYYVPFIYFATRPVHHDFKLGFESNKLITFVRKVVIWIFGDFSKIYLALFTVLLVFFAASSSYKHYNYYKSLQKYVKVEVKNFQEIDSILYSNSKDVIVAFSDPVMINFATAKSYKTLWPNSFSNKISQDEIIQKIVLHAKIFNWSYERFLSFMLSGNFQRADAVVNLLDEDSFSGMGYWLVFHKRNLSKSRENNYVKTLKKVFDENNSKDLIKKYKVSYIVGAAEPNIFGVSFKEIFKKDKIRIFKIDE